MSYTQELEDGLRRLEADLAASRNDTRLSQGVYDLAKFNIANLESETAALRERLRHAEGVVDETVKWAHCVLDRQAGDAHDMTLFRDMVHALVNLKAAAVLQQGLRKP